MEHPVTDFNYLGENMSIQGYHKEDLIYNQNRFEG